MAVYCLVRYLFDVITDSLRGGFKCLLYLAEIRFINASNDWNYFPDDSDYWIKGADGKPIRDGGPNSPWWLMDFTPPDVQ